MTPRAIEDLLAASVARRMAGRTLLDEDHGTVLEVDAANHIARVTISDVELWVPFGKAAPRVGRVYPVRRTLEGARWLVAGGVTACRTWTFDSDFNEAGSQFFGDVINAPAQGWLQLPTSLIYGDGRDGAATFATGDGDKNLNNVSICGRAYPDAAFVRLSQASSYWLPSFKFPGYATFTPPVGLAVGDECVGYVAQAGKDITDGQCDGLIGRGITFRLAFIDPESGMCYHKIQDPLPAGGFGAAFEVVNGETVLLSGQQAYIPDDGSGGGHQGFCVYIQRVPNYTTLTKTGAISFDAIVPTPHSTAGPSGGSGIVFIRANNELRGMYNTAGCGYKGGEGSAYGYYDHTMAVPWNAHVAGGDGLRIWRWDGMADPAQRDHASGGYQVGGWAGEDGRSTSDHSNDNHQIARGHAANTGSQGGGGGHATEGGVATFQRHAYAGDAMHDAGRTWGAGGDDTGQPEMYLGPTRFRAYFGGGGGGAGDVLIGTAGSGGGGGGLIILFAPTITPTGSTPATPTTNAQGAAGEFLAGGGAGGSVIMVADLVQGDHNATGGAGGGGTQNATEHFSAGGTGGDGRLHILYNSSGGGITPAGSALLTTPIPTLNGCWISAPLDGAALGLDAGEPLLAVTFTAHFYFMGPPTELDLRQPTFWVESAPDNTFTPGGGLVRYGPFQYGSGKPIVAGEPVDLAAEGAVPAPCWRVQACLDSGVDPAGTPVVDELQLCLEGG